jgi:hypothetical protein
LKRILYLSILCVVASGLTHSQATQETATRQRTSVYTETLNSSHELIGPLGKPLGELITITAKVEPKKRKGAFEDYVSVSKVNGILLQEPRKMPVRLWQWANTKKLLAGQELLLRAYQDGGMIGVPLKAMQETVFVGVGGYSFTTWLVVINEVRRPM